MPVWNPNVNVNRRKAPRFKVDWTATLTCYADGHEENVEVRVSDVSISGARLQLKSLQIGPLHLVVSNESTRFTLKVSLPEGAFWSPVSIVWYSSGREKELFDVGVMFLSGSEERKAAIEELMANVALEPDQFQC